jgi:tetratricopeptide (TPR) repeat protein
VKVSLYDSSFGILEGFNIQRKSRSLYTWLATRKFGLSALYREYETMASAMAVDNPQAGAGRPLPKKEADLFRNVVKQYEIKQYKKAIKAADAILKKYPNHGETLAMKGLTLNYMSKRDEAHALVKEGLMNDMRYVMCAFIQR